MITTNRYPFPILPCSRTHAHACCPHPCQPQIKKPGKTTRPWGIPAPLLYHEEDTSVNAFGKRSIHGVLYRLHAGNTTRAVCSSGNKQPIGRNNKYVEKNCYGRAGKVCGDRSTGRTTSGLLHVDLSSLIRTATHPFPDWSYNSDSKNYVESIKIFKKEGRVETLPCSDPTKQSHEIPARLFACFINQPAKGETNRADERILLYPNIFYLSGSMTGSAETILFVGIAMAFPERALVHLPSLLLPYPPGALQIDRGLTGWPCAV